MLAFLKYLIQLILSPLNGWDDLAEHNPDPEELLRRGLFPMMGVAAATEFLAFAYSSGVKIAAVLIAAVGDFGAYFVSVYIARLLFETYFERLCGTQLDRHRANLLIVSGIGLMVLFRIIANCLPWQLIILQLLPVYVVLVLSRATTFMSIPKRSEMRFLGLSAGALVGVPLIIYYLIFAII